MPQGLQISKQALSDLYRRRHIRRLSLFGSAARDDFQPDSDVDILIEFEPGYSAGFLRLHEIGEELSVLFGGRKIDLVNPKFINPMIKGEVLSHAEALYGQT